MFQCTKAVHTETKLLDDDFDANENQRLEDLPRSYTWKISSVVKDKIQ